MRLKRLRSIRVSFLFYIAGALLVPACGGNSTPPPNAGATCTLSSDCQSPLICTVGRCHAQCAESRDCNSGERCVNIDGNNICQLSIEAKCTYNSSCTSPLVCAVDLQCRAQCQTERDCTKGQVCTVNTKVCAEPTEVNAGQDLTPVVAPDGGTASGVDAGSSTTSVDAPMTGQADAPGAADVPISSGPVNEFQNAWRSAILSDAGVMGTGDGGTASSVQALPTPAPTASPASADPPRIVTLSAQLVDSALLLTITYEADNAIASTLVAPSGAGYYVRVMSPQPKTPSHPMQFGLSLALPANLAQLAANGLATSVIVALQDSANLVSSLVAVTLTFQRPDGGASVVGAASAGKVCTWGQPTACLPDGTGLLTCAVDELSVQVVDCQAGPPAFTCGQGPDGGAAECVCPNRCAAESRACGTDSCGHSCGTCPAGAECDPLGNCRFRAQNGCADGTREGFTDTGKFPTIAACEVWWDGAQSMRSPRSTQAWCGNSTGIKCNVPADGCAPGWHLCMQGGWPADIRDRQVNASGIDAGTTPIQWSDCANANHGHWFAAGSSSAYPGSQGGSCSAFPLGCYADDVAGYMDTIACGDKATNSGSCNSAIWSGATFGTSAPCTAVTIIRTDQNGVMCCQDPELTGS